MQLHSMVPFASDLILNTLFASAFPLKCSMRAALCRVRACPGMPRRGVCVALLLALQRSSVAVMLPQGSSKVKVALPCFDSLSTSVTDTPALLGRRRSIGASAERRRALRERRSCQIGCGGLLCLCDKSGAALGVQSFKFPSRAAQWLHPK